MIVRYSGDMTGYHVVGKKGFRLVPGENEVTPGDGALLLAADLVTLPPAPKKTKSKKKTKNVVSIGNIDPVEGDDGRAEGNT